MRRKVLFAFVGGLAVLLVAGGLVASNMGFKLNYVLDGQGTNGSFSGTNTLALPFNQQTDLVDAFDLIQDIGGTTVVQNLQDWNRSTDGWVNYTGQTGAAFPLVSGNAYRVQLQPATPSLNYIVVGSHDPGKAIVFDGQGTNGSASGTNFYAYPYHSTSQDAFELIAELGGTGTIQQIQSWNRAADGWTGYTGQTGVAFPLQPGKGYRVQLQQTVPSIQFVPSHF
jgi:hypothetical protein